MRRASPRTQWIAGWAVAVTFLLFGAGMAWYGGLGLVRAFASVDWPTTPGKVTWSKVEYQTSTTRTRDRSSTSRSAIARVGYAYAVDGIDYRGGTVAYGDHASSNTGHAESIVARYPVGAEVAVRYMPGNPGESVLEPGARLQAWIIPGFGVLFLIVGCIAAVVLPRIAKARMT